MAAMNVRVFKWDSSKFSMNIKPGDYEISMKFDRVILIRSPAEVAVVPCSFLDMTHSSIFENFLTEIMKPLPFLGSFNDIHDLASDMVCEVFLKFGSKKMWFNDPNRALVILFDVKSNNDPRTCLPDKQEVRVEKVCSRRTSIISTHKADAEMDLEKVEEIEEYLKTCPGLTVVGGSRAMKEIKGFLEINVLSGSEEEEDELGCPICLERIDVSDRYATTNCSHSFHRKCLQEWMHLCKHSCPMCRSVFQVSV